MKYIAVHSTCCAMITVLTMRLDLLLSLTLNLLTNSKCKVEYSVQEIQFSYAYSEHILRLCCSVSKFSCFARGPNGKHLYLKKLIFFSKSLRICFNKLMIAKHFVRLHLFFNTVYEGIVTKCISVFSVMW